MQYLFDPIGVVHSPFVERAAAPRQAVVAPGHDAGGRIELFAGRGFEDALCGLEAWERLWVLFVFHRNVEQGRGWKPKVQPPRARAKVGVFATRSPHRPNPLGMSAVRIERVEGLVVYVRDLDLLDGTPVLDLKPYVAYADAHRRSKAGWLLGDPRAPSAPLSSSARDPLPAWRVMFTERASEQLAWLCAHGVDLREAIESRLALGPQPHAYRRIRKHGDGMRLALNEWRVDFVVEGDTIIVQAIATGYRPRQLATDPGLELHRALGARFGS
jgi:tRNA-Thr(GGU) m(6)t(6)A37 methyltransferase TsaA